uniref:Solute carrier family 46 member 3 n=1 Tax=Ditylenchus dipsaci TaxID=166011 RepID=A0A915CPW8_9BILA
MSTMAEDDITEETSYSWKTRLTTFVKELKIHTEPLILLISLCNGAKNVLQPHLSEAKMQRAYQPPSGLDPTALKKFYNKKMVSWEQNYTYVNVPMACFIGLLYGAYSDRKGRKLPILLGILSTLLDCMIRTFVWWDWVDLDLKWLFVDAAINGLLGGTSITMMNAYLVDKFRTTTLSVRMILFSAIFSVGALLGVQLASVFIRFINIQENQEERSATPKSTLFAVMLQGIIDLQVLLKYSLVFDLTMVPCYLDCAFS